ncbi:helix-turn-helix domain-containing protein [Curtobacterium sp. MCBD17_019]|uniref:helix-turn-helix domain-containing protein n=1 Tax=Curtobacterium sp. MCBD17_019 TaxID=2175669 RepID=UPI000DA81EFB|nr:helix-turn-helix domain-containing protein [Curtobacterium sp. MCBD17_019]PZE77818.1 transcriptional regulator [Curtobacterium sp. MCBD17_019]
MAGKNPHLEELGLFLKARRSELTPQMLGLDAGEPGSRRVSGLRREEVAAAVAISVDYYTRIEQGRLAPSAPVLDALSSTFRLTPVEREYVEGLAQHADQRVAPRRRQSAVSPQLQRLLDRLDGTPAFVVGKYLDYLAWNPLAGALLLDLEHRPPQDRNYVRMLFADPRARALYHDWESMARTAVALLRSQAADSPHDPRLAAIVGELSIGYPQFRTWWADRHVAGGGQGTKTVHHPEIGALTFDWDSFQPLGVVDQHITIWTPAAGTPTDDKLRILSSWIASSDARSPSNQVAPDGAPT